MKTAVDPHLCIGCELCVQICPDIFAMEENLATVIVDEVPADIEPPCREAMETCPLNAITVEE